MVTWKEEEVGVVLLSKEEVDKMLTLTEQN